MKNKLTLHEWLPLIGMTCATFFFVTSEFMPVGLLTTIAADFAMTEAATGRIVSYYAWVVMLLSTPLMILVSRYSMKSLILGTLTLFVISNALSFFSGGFWTLLGARLILACAHAVFWSIAVPAAVRMVPPEQKTIAMTMLIGGSSLAVILGMPLGRIIGLQLGWRMTFLSMAGAAACILAYMFFVFPPLEKTKPFSFKELPVLLRNRILLLLFGITVVVSSAQYAAYSYIEPFMKYVAAMSDEAVTLSLMIFGISGLLGSMLFARSYSSHAKVFMPVVLLILSVVLFMLQGAAVHEFTLMGLLVLWGIVIICFNMAGQSDLLQVTDVSTAPVAMSIYSGLFNCGIGTGTWIGGQICDYISLDCVGYGASILALTGFAGSIFLARSIYDRGHR